MGNPRVTPVARQTAPNVTPAQAKQTIKNNIKAMSKAHKDVEVLYRQAYRMRDIIKSSCTHEKTVRIKNYLALAHEAVAIYEKKVAGNTATAADLSSLRKQIALYRSNVGKLLKEARHMCSGKDIVVTSKPVVTETGDSRACFRWPPGALGSPRLTFVQGRWAGLGIKMSAGAEYVSMWDKNFGRADGVRALFNIGLSGINLTGGRSWGRAIFLLGLSGGVGFGPLYRRDAQNKREDVGETIYRAGIDLHTVGFAKGLMTLMLKGGYQTSTITKDEDSPKEVKHGGYASLGLELYIPKILLMSAQLNVGYAGYAEGRHEVSVNAMLRF